MIVNIRNTFRLADLAHIRSGKKTIAAIHNNSCPSLTGKAECTCGDDLEYRLVAVRKEQVR